MIKKNLGKIQVYTGHSKGKTTAALGLAVRARGRGLKVAIIYFDKGGWHYGERNMLGILGIDFWVTGCVRFNEKTKKFRFGVNDDDKAEGKKGLDITRQIFVDKKYDILVLDEINSSLNLGIVEVKEFLPLLEKKPTNMELIMTGRDIPKNIAAKADLITEMKMIKHYFYQGVEARKGIEY